MNPTNPDARPRAFYPHGAAEPLPPQRTPGWDIGPEQRLDEGTMMKGALVGLGLLAMAAVAAYAIREAMARTGENERAWYAHGGGLR